MVRLLRTLDRALFRLENALIVAILLFMVIFAFLQVVLRDVLGRGFLWGDILLRHLVLWVGFIGASLATRDNRHINIDVFSRFLSPGGQRAVQVVTSLIAAGVSFVLSRAAITFVAMERESGSIVFGNVPTWWLQLIIPIGFAMIGLRFIIRTLQLLFDPEGLPQAPPFQLGEEDHP